jgi:hypothetical protein
MRKNPLLTAIFAILLFFIASCKKNEQNNAFSAESKINLLLHRFLQTSDSTDASIKKIITFIGAQKNYQKFAQQVVSESGFPLWEKALLISKSSKISNRGTSPSPDTNYIFVPLVPEGTKEVEGIFACKTFGDSVKINYLSENDYESFGFDSSKNKNATEFVALLMHIQNRVFGTQSFVINDQRLFPQFQSYSNSSQKKVLSVRNRTQPAGQNRLSNKSLILAYYVTVQICIEVSKWGCPITSHTGQNCGHSGVYTITECIDFNAWVDDGSGSGGSTGGGGTGGSGSTGGNGGTTAVSSTISYLSQTLNLYTDQLVFLNPYPGLCEEMYNYLNAPDGILTAEERNNLAKSHILYLSQNSTYLAYCNKLNEDRFSFKGFPLPWFHNDMLHFDDPELFSLIQNLKLHAQQAYFLLNNSTIKNDVFQFSNLNNFSESSNFKSHASINYVLLGYAFESPSTLLVDNIDYDAITNPCIRAALEKMQLPRFVNYASNLVRTLGSSSQFRIALLPMNGLNNGMYAYTNKLFDFDMYKYVINVDMTLLPKCSEEFIIETLMHEFMHVEILSNPNWDNNNSQHQKMLEDYMKILVSSIRNVFPNLPLKDAYAIVYGGFAPESKLTAEQKEKFRDAQQVAFNSIKKIFSSITATELDNIYYDYDEGGTKGSRTSNCQ